MEAATGGNWDIQMVRQPARSPDLNILDLGFFRSLQSQQWASGFANTLEEMVEKVEQELL